MELLTFTVPADELDAWLAADARHWTRFLERQPGFVRKEVWCGIDVEGAEPSAGQVHAAICWRSVEEWKAIAPADLEEVVAAMGPFEGTAVCHAYDVVRVAPGTTRTISDRSRTS